MRLLLTGITINPFIIKYIPEKCFNSMVLFSTRRDAVEKGRALAWAVTFFTVNFTLVFFFFFIFWLLMNMTHLSPGILAPLVLEHKWQTLLRGNSRKKPLEASHQADFPAPQPAALPPHSSVERICI